MRRFRIPFAMWKKCVCVSVCLSACVWAPQTLIYATCIVLMQQIAMSCNTTIPSNNWHSINVVLDFTGSTNQKYFFWQLSWQMLRLWELSCGLHGQNIPNQRHWKTADNSLQDLFIWKCCTHEHAPMGKQTSNMFRWKKHVQSAFGLFSWNLSGIWPLLLRAPPFKWNCHGGGIEFQQITKVIGSSRLPMNQSNVACLTCQSPFQFFTMASQNLITDVFKKNIPARDPKQQCGKVGG